MGNNLIDRQAAIDALTHKWDGMVTSVFDVINSLPSAQPDVPDTNVGDMISRQTAIEELDRGAWGVEWDKALAKAMLESLPSAQPEIVRCKNCKHKHLENAVWTCPFGLPGGPDFYCGYGAERRTDETTI